MAAAASREMQKWRMEWVLWGDVLLEFRPKTFTKRSILAQNPTGG
jgi:hypothetical protein